jgi:hypothetical protein
VRTDLAGQRGTGLVDLLDRVLDKGLLIAGNIRISLADVELLTIRIRLIVCSIDKAQEIGLDWWKYDRYLAPRHSGPGGRDGSPASSGPDPRTPDRPACRNAGAHRAPARAQADRSHGLHRRMSDGH